MKVVKENIKMQTFTEKQKRTIPFIASAQSGNRFEDRYYEILFIGGLRSLENICWLITEKSFVQNSSISTEGGDYHYATEICLSGKGKVEYTDEAGDLWTLHRAREFSSFEVMLGFGRFLLEPIKFGWTMTRKTVSRTVRSSPTEDFLTSSNFSVESMHNKGMMEFEDVCLKGNNVVFKERGGQSYGPLEILGVV